MLAAGISELLVKPGSQRADVIRNHCGPKRNIRVMYGSQPICIHRRGVLLMRQSSQNQPQELSTESVDIPGTELRVVGIRT
jgi:hypothetical protein